MKFWGSLVAAVASTLALLAGPASAADEHNVVPGLPVYLALGDSWTFGEGASDPATEGYVPQLLQVLRTDWDCSPSRSDKPGNGCKHLQLVNLGRGATGGMDGVTAETVISEQLPVAEALLESRNSDSNPRNDVELITLQVGGNDVTLPILGACTGTDTSQCIPTIQSEFGEFTNSYGTVLRHLREAAGPATRIVVGTYGNPIPFCNLNNPAFPGIVQLAGIVLEGGAPGVDQGLNDIIRTLAARHGAEAAEVYRLLDERQDWVGGPDCLHPANQGYDKITAAFADVIL